MLARSFTVRKEKNEKLLMPTRVEGTRLVAHLVQALINPKISYKCIMTHLEQVSTYKYNYWRQSSDLFFTFHTLYRLGQDK